MAASPELLRRYGMMVALSADSVAELRRCDVFRVVDAALGCELSGFPAWLVAARPDLAPEVADAVSEVAWLAPADRAPAPALTE